MLDPRTLPLMFKNRFGDEPLCFRAPGRVNLIGEHTDYNDGFVLPAALNLATYVAIAPRKDQTINVHSANLDANFTFSLKDTQTRGGNWSDYIRGVAVELLRSGFDLKGADVLILSTLSMGSGLSASAALEAGFGYALLRISNHPIDLVALARICQRAENEFVGMRCGIMDQFISCHGVQGAALLLDCRSLQARPVCIDPSVRIVISNTMAHHQLASSAFNQRRAECEEAMKLLSAVLGDATALRDVSMTQLEEHERLLPPTIRARARHVVSENTRTLRAVEALEKKDFITAGRLMNASHDSLRDDFEVSCRELDLMVDLARAVPGVFGSRMTGGGFGGCTVSLVEAAAVKRFAEEVAPSYEKETGLKPTIFSCLPGPGVGPVVL